MVGVLVDTFATNSFNRHFNFVYNVLRGVRFLLEGKNKIGAADNFFAVFAYEMWMLIHVGIVCASVVTKCVHRAVVGCVDGVCNTILDKSLQGAVNGYAVGRVEEVLDFGE